MSFYGCHKKRDKKYRQSKPYGDMKPRHYFSGIGSYHKRKRDGKNINSWKFFKIKRIKKMKQDEEKRQKEKRKRHKKRGKK